MNEWELTVTDIRQLLTESGFSTSKEIPEYILRFAPALIKKYRAYLASQCEARIHKREQEIVEWLKLAGAEAIHWRTPEEAQNILSAAERLEAWLRKE